MTDPTGAARGLPPARPLDRDVGEQRPQPRRGRHRLGRPRVAGLGRRQRRDRRALPRRRQGARRGADRPSAAARLRHPRARARGPTRSARSRSGSRRPTSAASAGAASTAARPAARTSSRPRSRPTSRRSTCCSPRRTGRARPRRPATARASRSRPARHATSGPTSTRTRSRTTRRPGSSARERPGKCAANPARRCVRRTTSRSAAAVLTDNCKPWRVGIGEILASRRRKATGRARVPAARDNPNLGRRRRAVPVARPVLQVPRRCVLRMRKRFAASAGAARRERGTGRPVPGRRSRARQGSTRTIQAAARRRRRPATSRRPGAGDVTRPSSRARG